MSGNSKAKDKDKFRTELLEDVELRPNTLVGSFFHGDDDHQWQGVIVAEPAPGIYLCELYSWIAGDPSEQVLVRIEDIMGFHFYDTAKWMNGAYEDTIQRRWEHHSTSKRRRSGIGDSNDG